MTFVTFFNFRSEVNLNFNIERERKRNWRRVTRIDESYGKKEMTISSVIMYARVYRKKTQKQSTMRKKNSHTFNLYSFSSSTESSWQIEFFEICRGILLPYSVNKTFGWNCVCRGRNTGQKLHLCTESHRRQAEYINTFFQRRCYVAFFSKKFHQSGEASKPYGRASLNSQW